MQNNDIFNVESYLSTAPKEVSDIEISNAESGAPIDGETEIYIGNDLSLTCAVKPDWFKDEPVSLATGDSSANKGYFDSSDDEHF